MVPLHVIAAVTGGTIVSPQPIPSKAVELTEHDLDTIINCSTCSQRIKY